MATNEIHFPLMFKIKQTATAGSQFDGTLPTSTRTFDGRLVKYATHTAGGLLDPHAELEYIGHGGLALDVIELYLGLDGANTAWDIHKVDADGVEALWIEGEVGTEGEQFWLRGDCPPLLPGEKLKVTTTDCAAAIPLWGIFAPAEGV
jgi:hypothetical protein